MRKYRCPILHITALRAVIAWPFWSGICGYKTVSAALALTDENHGVIHFMILKMPDR
jgi:hypothetical protein